MCSVLPVCYLWVVTIAVCNGLIAHVGLAFCRHFVILSRRGLELERGGSASAEARNVVSAKYGAIGRIRRLFATLATAHVMWR